MALSHANRILDWFENLSGDETPPEWMWPFDPQLKIWFDQVDEERKTRFGGGDAQEEQSDAPYVENEYAKEWRKGM